MKKVTFVNTAAKTRLKAIAMLQAGATQKDVADRFNVHYTTIAEWARMYEQGGAEALNTELRPRSTAEIDRTALDTAIATETDQKKRIRLNRLLRTLSEPLNVVAKSEGVSAQAIMKDRRKFVEQGKL